MQARNSHFDLDRMGPEVRSYVYQTILEFEPYTTPQTVVSVIARDPLRSADADQYDSARLKKMWRIAITMTEDGSQIEEEALHDNLYEAIRLAKEKLAKTLSEIHDSVVSSQDRMIQINNAMAGHQLH